MERRAFLKLLCIGAGVVAAGAPAEALTSFVPLAAPSDDPDLAPQPGVVTSKDTERAQVEKAWYGHWRRDLEDLATKAAFAAGFSWDCKYKVPASRLMPDSMFLTL